MKNPSETTRHRDEPSLKELLNDLKSETQLLIQKEVQLAKSELKQKSLIWQKSAKFIGIGGALAYAGLLVILGGIVLILATFLALWLAALVVGVVTAGIGYSLLQKGSKDLQRTPVVPEQTRETLEEDKRWLKAQT